MSATNPRWGAERIRGELLKLGIHVSKRTVQRYMLAQSRRAPGHGQGWRTFIANHVTWSCDFVQAFDALFRRAPHIGGRIIARPILHGLHHDYQRASSVPVASCG